MTSFPGTVCIIDDEEEIRSSVGNLCEEMQLQVRLFESPDAFIEAPLLVGPSCIVSDVRFPGVSPTGLDLQTKLQELGRLTPVVFISAYLDIRVAVEAMKRGAADFIPKPFREQEILDAIRHAIEYDRARLDRDHALEEAKQGLEALTLRERQIMLLMADGFVAKQMASRLGISEVTVKVHRASMMRKMKFRSPIAAARLIDAVGRDFVTSKIESARPGEKQSGQEPLLLGGKHRSPSQVRAATLHNST